MATTAPLSTYSFLDETAQSVISTPNKQFGFTVGQPTNLSDTFAFVLFFMLAASGVAAMGRVIYALSLRVLNSDDPAKVTAANKIITTSLTVLLGSFSLVVLFMAVNPDVVSGNLDFSKVGTKNSAPATGEIQYNQTSGTGLSSNIYNAAVALMNKPLITRDVPNTNNGRLACAYAVNEVLKLAGLAPMGTLAVSQIERALTGGRGVRVAQSSTVPGDIDIEAGGGHVGVCLNQGCSSVVSNSSNATSFTWRSGPDFLPSYRNGAGRFYRVTN